MHIKERGPRDGSIRRLAFLDISLPLLHDVKFFSFTLYGGREHKTTIFFSFTGFRYNPLQSTYIYNNCVLLMIFVIWPRC